MKSHAAKHMATAICVTYLLSVLYVVSPMPVYHAHGGYTHQHAYGGFHHNHRPQDGDTLTPAGNVAIAEHRAEHTGLDADAIRARMVPERGEQPKPRTPAEAEQAVETGSPADLPGPTPERRVPEPGSGYVAIATPFQTTAAPPALLDAAPIPAAAWIGPLSLVSAERFSGAVPRGPPAIVPTCQLSIAI